MSYYFEWDLEKAAANLRKHGVPFEEATTVFGDPLAMNMPDPDHSSNEERFILLGLSHRLRLLVVAYVRGERDADAGNKCSGGGPTGTEAI